MPELTLGLLCADRPKTITSTARLMDLFWREVRTDLAEPHPADANRDWVLSATEFSAYGAGWKSGQAWPTGPNPIPLDYVTRAGYLNAKGGAYRQATGRFVPEAWVPAPGGSTRR
jgi:hypothetical protein